jgi:cell division protein FtsQ
LIRSEEPSVGQRLPWFWKPVLLVGLLGVSVGALWYFWDNEIRDAYPIRYVRVEGSTLYLDDAAFLAAIAPLTREGILDVNLGAIKAAASSFAWVDAVRVVRRWPDTLILEVREHRPLARWNENGLVSDRGIRFTPPSVEEFSQLPRLYGKEGQETAVLDVWRKLNELVRTRKWLVTMLSCNFRESWTARLSDGKELILGRQDPVAGVAYFLERLPQLGDRQTAAIKKADLRYRNGFSVVWRFEQETDALPVENEEAAPRVLKRAPETRASSPLLAVNQ